MDIASRVVSAMSRVANETPEKIKPAKVGMVVDVSDAKFIGGLIPSLVEKQLYPYSRPEFLYFSEDEILLSADQSVRPVLCPKYPSKMPLYAGYAEVINAGTYMSTVVKASSKDDDELVSPNGGSTSCTSSTGIRAEAALFAIFDGHAGSGAALVASRCLHEHIKSRLGVVLESIIQLDRNETLLSSRARSDSSYSISKMDSVSIRCDELVVGALEAAFVDMAYQNPELIGNCFSRLEYSRTLSRKDLKTKVLFRDWFMDGWAAKTVKECDLKPPLISDCTRKRRLLNTIGVSRGFGDHHLFTVDDHLPIKPFLSSVPEVRVFDLRNLDVLSDKDILIVASDGLWDVLSNEDAGLIVRSSLSATEQSEQSRYTMAAQELAIAARGYPSGNNGHRWTMNSGGSASTDDITKSLDNRWFCRYTMAAQELAIAARGYPSGNNGHRWTMNSGGSASTDDITVFVIPLKYCVAPPPEDDDDDEMISLCAED
ncbi:unnamed protein product [Haemonchus placei]|uniref:PPM-type phosphatase domain-containing protein n=1 Tax=Haemonchus placei TaxID=6290 RepID=A0A0N4WIC5_HAEPC|nr:unnamed protein product [Haemonchus placei]